MYLISKECICIYIYNKSFQGANNSEMMQIHRQGCYWKERSNAPLFSDLARSEWCWKKIFHILIIVLMDRILHMILPNQEMCVFHILFALHHRVLSYIQCRFSDWPQFNDLFVEVISLRLLNAVFTFLLIGFLQPSALWLHWYTYTRSESVTRVGSIFPHIYWQKGPHVAGTEYLFWSSKPRLVGL